MTRYIVANIRRYWDGAFVGVVFKNIIFISLLTVLLCGCTHPGYYRNKYSTVSKSLMQDWKKCGANFIYSVGVDTIHSTAIQFTLCFDGNRFNAKLPPVIGKEGITEFYSGTYTAANDTLILNFDKQHIPQFLGNRIVYDVDKKHLFWINVNNNEMIKLSVMKPGMNINDR